VSPLSENASKTMLVNSKAGANVEYVCTIEVVTAAKANIMLLSYFILIYTSKRPSS